MMNADVLGIDLGTTNSLVAIWEPEPARARVLPAAEGGLLTPSMVAFGRQPGPLVGEAARAGHSIEPEKVLYSVKRFIGRTFREPSVREDQARVPFRIEEATQQRIRIRVADRGLSPEQVSAEVLRKLKADAELALGRTFTRAVITVPAYFNEAQRQATLEAADLADIRVERLLHEPTAAALAFGLGPTRQTVAIYDLGGGTFDISVVHIDRGLFKVLATDGDTHLGGDDFDQAIISWIDQALRSQCNLQLDPTDAALKVRLRQAAEQAKIRLSSELEHVIRLPIPAGAGGEDFVELTLTRRKLEALTRAYIDRTLEICARVLERAKLDSEAIQQVLLVGGQTRSPHVRAALQARFGWKVNDEVDPDLAVALGAAMYGARRCGYLREHATLWDVTPLRLSVLTDGGVLATLFESNSAIPNKVRRQFTTTRDGQERVFFHVYQGEQSRVEDNVLIGTVRLDLPAALPRQVPRIECEFEIDSRCVLTARARDLSVEGRPVEVRFDYLSSVGPEEPEPFEGLTGSRPAGQPTEVQRSLIQKEHDT